MRRAIEVWVSTEEGGGNSGTRYHHAMVGCGGKILDLVLNECWDASRPLRCERIDILTLLARHAEWRQFMLSNPAEAFAAASGVFTVATSLLSDPQSAPEYSCKTLGLIAGILNTRGFLARDHHPRNENETTRIAGEHTFARLMRQKVTWSVCRLVTAKVDDNLELIRKSALEALAAFLRRMEPNSPRELEAVPKVQVSSDTIGDGDHGTTTEDTCRCSTRYGGHGVFRLGISYPYITLGSSH